VCVAKTIASDSFWGAVGGAASTVGYFTFTMGAAGSDLGPEGTAAGAGLGFAFGVTFAPAGAADGLWTGAQVGVLHGTIRCASRP
jgi:hypothetical protein